MPQNNFLAFVSKTFGGNPALMALDKQSGLLTSTLHGSKYQQAYQKNLFVGANQAGATLSNGLATTYTGLVLSNPAASTKNLVVRRSTAIIVVAPAAMIGLGLITGYAAGGITVHTTPVATLGPTFLGDVTVPQAKLDAAATLVGTPVWSYQMVSNAATAGNASFNIDLEGALVIPPGGYVAIGTVLAAGPTAGLLASFEWEEVAP